MDESIRATRTRGKAQKRNISPHASAAQSQPGEKKNPSSDVTMMIAPCTQKHHAQLIFE